MLNISFGELLVFATIALIILGPEKLPQTLRSTALKYRQFKNTLNKIQQDLENELELAELKRLMDIELNKIKANEQDLKAQLLQMQQEIDLLNQDVMQPETSKVSPQHTESTLRTDHQSVTPTFFSYQHVIAKSTVRVPYRDDWLSPLQYVRKVA